MERRAVLATSVVLVLVAVACDDEPHRALNAAPASQTRCVEELFSRHLVPKTALETKEVREERWLPDFLPTGFAHVAGSGGEAGPVWSDRDCRIIAMYSGQGPDVPESEPNLGRWLLAERPRATTFDCPTAAQCWVFEANFRDISLRVETLGLERSEAARVAESIG